MSKIKATLESIATSRKNAEERFETFISEFLKRNEQLLQAKTSPSLRFSICLYPDKDKTMVKIQDHAHNVSSTFATTLSFGRIVAIFEEADCTVSLSKEIENQADVSYWY